MSASARVLSHLLFVTLPLAVAVLLASALATLLQLPPVLRILAPPIMTLCAAPLLWWILDPGRRRLAEAQSRLAESEARAAELTRAASQMRHDLRGILSPALLTADRLAMSQDPTSKRAGETMIATVERAEARLRA